MIRPRWTSISSHTWYKVSKVSPYIRQHNILSDVYVRIMYLCLFMRIDTGYWQHNAYVCNHPLSAQRHRIMATSCLLLESSWNVMAHVDAREGKWRGNWRMEWVASTLHTTSEHGVSSVRVHLKPDGTRWRTGWEVKGKLANGVGSQFSLHYLGTWCIQHYYRWCAHLGCQQSTELTPPPIKIDSSVSAKDEMWFQRVCHHVSNGLYLLIGHRTVFTRRCLNIILYVYCTYC